MKVSILIPTYNNQQFLETAILSALNQTHKDKEIIVIDDGSTDNSFSVLTRWRKNFDVDIRHMHGWGLSGTLNQALKRSSGDYVIRLDGDDILRRDSLSIQAELLDNNKRIDFVIPDHTIFGKAREYKSINIHNIMSWIGCGNMYRTKAVRTVQGWRDFVYEEHDLHLRLIESGFQYCHLPMSLYYYRQHEKSMSADPELMKKGKKELENHWETALMVMSSKGVWE